MTELDTLSIATIRSLVIDMINKATSGHPGFSEHQTGLTIDVCLDYNHSDLDVVRENPPHYSKFLETLHEYGFILRYGDDKTEYTHIAPESWHIRYVGKDLATYLYENDLCLDEYYGLVDAKLIKPIE